MIKDGVIRTVCNLCTGCSILVHLKDGKVIKTEGDPQSHINKGLICDRGLASAEYLYHPDRLKYPLKRVGKRGEGKWQQVSWDEALEQISQSLNTLKEKYGAESVAFVHGGAKGYRDSYMARLAYVFGTPNVSWQGHVCAIPGQLGSQLTYGTSLGIDYENNPGCIMVWASSPPDTHFPGYPHMIEAMRKGTKIISVDPRPNELTKRADIWLKVRPASDLALALGLINVIINENLYDKDFVKDYTVGFDELKTHVQSYSPEKVAKLTWIDADTIRKAARFFVENKPGSIILGNGIEHNINSFQTSRAVSILRAITGNIGVTGGQSMPSGRAMVMARKGPELELWAKISKEQWQKRVDAKHKYLPIVRYVPPESVIKAVLEEDPYPIKAIYMGACNSLLTHASADYVLKALKKLDLLVVADLFMTPTASMADFVLPVSGYLEHNDIRQIGPAILAQQKVAQIGECRSDYEILSGLARKLGLGEYFWNSEEECLDALLKPSKITFDDLRKTELSSEENQPYNYKAKGFQTPSRKVEIYSSMLKGWGFDPLPVYYEPPETALSSPELAKEYPLTFTTWKPVYFRHSRLRQI
ncbi:MAG: molybdopterin-dependent oxidoreductase, partial [Chloroflexi bacterium]|nr:molybdopterin-dependent oxidoreductase [Chloroflexota bacterium]